MIALTATAACHACEWSAPAGTAAQVDKAAQRHTTVTGHPTATQATPAREEAARDA